MDYDRLRGLSDGVETVMKEGAQGAPACVRLGCWGDFAIADPVTGADLKPRGRKARAVLAYLALHPGKPVSRDRLTGLLWGDRADEQARASLRQAIVELKPFSNGEHGLLDVERDHLTLNPAALVTDIDEMRRAAARGDGAALLAALPEPHERLFANLEGIDEGFDDWLVIERMHQQDALVALIADASTATAAAGNARDARALDARVREWGGDGSQPPVNRRDAPPGAPAADVALAGPVNRQRWWIALIVALLLAASILAVGAARWGSGASGPPTLAVLPFSNLSGANDAYFADGISEEIMAQLGREPGLRVAGRTSSWQFKDRTADLDAIGRKLGVAYILEGSVRSAAGKVRVNVALVQASDGMQLWTETFDGTLDDVLAIQHRIGANVTHKLQQRLVRATPPAGAQATSGAVYSLYLSARGLIRERNSVAVAAAKEKLTRALRLDPDFAPAWASLAQVTRFEANAPGPEAQGKREQAIGQARKALSLTPDLAEAHGVLGMVLGFDDPLGQRHIKRAAALDPGSAQFQFWLGHVYGNEHDFPRQLAAYRRAFEIDPLWHFAQFEAVRSAWEMGRRQEAIGYVRRVERDASRHQVHLVRAALAQARGDFSAQAAELAAAAAATDDPGKKTRAAYERAFVCYNLGLFDRARTEWSKVWHAGGAFTLRPERMGEYEIYFAIRRGRLPSLAELRTQSASTFHKDQAYAAQGAKLLINAGRARDVVALYDGDGILGLANARPLDHFSGRMEGGAIVAAALRAVGRTAEADAILVRLDRTILAGLARSRSRAPSSFLAEAANVWAMRGKTDAALSALERARQLGWVYVEPDEGDISLRDIGEEPAFRSLRGNPRFEAIRARINAHLARERRELAAIPI